MTTIENALAKYTQVMDKRKDYIEQHKAIFDGFEKIGMEIIDADNDLRDAVAETGTGINNGSFNVVVTPQTQRVYNEEKMKQYMNSQQFADVVSDVKRPPRITVSPVR